MTKAEEMKKDYEQLEKILRKYTGNEGAHICFIGSLKGGKYVCVGGRADISAYGMAKLLASIIQITPGLDEMFIVSVAEMAKEMLEDEVKGTVQ